MSQERTQRGDAQNMTPAEAVRGYEPDRVPGRTIVLAALGLLGVLLLSAAIVAGLMLIFQSRAAVPTASSIERLRIAPPAPRLETSPQGDAPALRSANAAKLSGAVDGNGMARVHGTIEDAMAFVAARGWPDQTGGLP